MAYSTLERWTGSAWINETYLLRFSLTDDLYKPSYVSLTIADPNGTVAANYSPYQSIRIKEGSTKIILFYGKIRNIVPQNDLMYGHIVLIEAKDNLAELSERSIEADYSLAQNSAWGRKSSLITSLISGYSTTHPAHSFSGNIDTTTSKVIASAVNETGTIKWNFNSEKSGKNVLNSIKQLSEKDPHSTSKEAFGYVFHLDYRTSGNTVYSDFNYRKRGADPTGAAVDHGLVVQFNGVESNRIKSMFYDYSFETENVQELVTRVIGSYVDEDKKPQTISFVLINTGAHSGTFTDGEAITWTGGNGATLNIVGGSGSTRLMLISDFTDAGLAALPGVVVTGSSSSETATVNASNVTPPGVLSSALGWNRIDSMNLEDYETKGEIFLEALAKLYMTNTSVERGDFRVSRWPYFTLTGTHTGSNNSAVLIDSSKTFTNSSINPGSMIENTTDGSSAEVSAVSDTQITGTLSGGTGNDWDTGDSYSLYKVIRVGESIHVINSKLSIAKEFLVTAIEYDEGAGVLQSTIRVLSVDRGNAERRNPSFFIEKRLFDSSGTKRAGIPLSQQSFISTITFSETDYNTVAWTTGSLTYGDGTAYTISSASNTGNMSDATTPYYVYFDSDASTTALQSTTTHANVVGKNKSLLATIFAGVTSVDPPQIRVQQGSLGSPSPKTFVQTSAPTSTATNPLKAGDIWFDSDDGNNLYRWTGSAWVSQRDTTIATAQTAADLKARTYIGGSPSGTTDGDLWIDTSNGSMLKRWNGSAWVDAESFLTNTWTNAGRTSVLGGKIETNLLVLNSATGSAANTANIVQDRTSSPGSAAAGTNRILLSADGIFGINSSNATNFAITQSSGGAGIFGGGAVVMDAGGLTMTSGGDIKSAGKTYNSTTAGFWLGYTGGAYKFEIGKTDGNYLQWTGSALEISGKISGAAEITLGGSGIDNTLSGSDVGGAGKITILDTDGDVALRIRPYPNYLYFDTPTRAIQFTPGGGGDDQSIAISPTSAGGTTTWDTPFNAVYPGTQSTYLGFVGDGGASSNDFGIGWKALVLQAIDTNSTTPTDGTLVLRAATATEEQYVFTFPAVPPTSSGHVLQSTTAGITSWVANASGGAAAAGTLTGSTLASGVTSSSLTTIGTIATGVWQGTDVGVAYGGTGASTLAAGYVLLGSGTSAITTLDVTAKGSILVGDGSGDPRALAVGTNNYVLTADSGEASGLKWATVSGAVSSIVAGDGISVSGATGDVTVSHNLTAGSNISLATSSGQVSITATNTTYSAGAGLDLSSTTFSHTDTSSQASVNNSGNTFVQDITLDTYGHITVITSAGATDTNTTYSAGTGLSLSGTTFNNTVTDTNTTYSAGDGITLSGTTFSHNITAGSNISMATSGGQLSIAATNTLFTATGAGLTLSGTTFSHTNTSSQANVDNSGNTFIQDISLDEFGHLTGITSAGATNTTYSAGDGITLSGTTFSTNLTSGSNISMATSGGQISIAATNTTYGATGNGLALAGTNFYLNFTFLDDRYLNGE